MEIEVWIGKEIMRTWEKNTGMERMDWRVWKWIVTDIKLGEKDWQLNFGRKCGKIYWDERLGQRTGSYILVLTQRQASLSRTMWSSALYRLSSLSASCG